MAPGRDYTPSDYSVDTDDRTATQSSYIDDTGSRALQRSRAGSNARSMQGPPMEDAAHNMFDRSGAVAGNSVHPDLVAHITKQVINSLKATGLDIQDGSSTAPQASQSPQAVQPNQESCQAGQPMSPTSSGAPSIPRRYTPPSPVRSDQPGYGSVSPEPQFAEPGSYPNGNDRRCGVNQSPPLQQQPPKFDERARPRPTKVPSTVEEATILEKIWQPLFDNGRPTMRLGQFLRGLAVHIIEDYEPKHSIVITPAKMKQFFMDVRVADEVYPWNDIFGGKMSHESLSRLYRDLRCQHHMVQQDWQSVPDIPSLTPMGFECLMTLLILAHPGLEFDRLAKAVLDMPISNADDAKERFPKELSRRLFPSTADKPSQQRLHAAISADRNIQLRSSIPMPPPPPQPQPQSNGLPERERNPYSSSSFSSSSSSYYSSVLDDEDLQTTPMPRPIERERQPYTAREGTGKFFDDTNNDARPNGTSSSSSSSYRPDTTTTAQTPTATTTTRPSRSSSAAPPPSSYQAQAPPQPYTPSSTARPTDIPPPNSQRHHRLSSTTGPRPISQKTNPYTRSEGANVGDIPAAHYASVIYGEGEEERRYGRRGAAEEERAYGGAGQVRGSAAGSGWEYGSPGGWDERRRGAGAGAGAGGSGGDGYGGHGGVYPPTSRY